MNNEFCLLIKEICKENGIECDVLSTGWILSLNKNGVRRFISGYKFDSNGHALGQILDDKFGTYELLRSCGIPVCEHNILYSRNNHSTYANGCNTFSYVEELFNKYNEDIVIKINNGTCGINVNRFRDLEVLREFFENLNTKSSYGDGSSSIKQLLEEFNYEYFKNIDDKKLDRVLDFGDEYIYSWKFNLSNGSKPSFSIDEVDNDNILEIVYRILNQLDLGFCSIDIIKTIENEYLVMEINSGVMMKNLIKGNDLGYNYAKEIYEKAVLALFS